jgi:hypothetical protein
MAQVRIEEIVDHLRSEMRRALEDAVKECIPNALFDSHELFEVQRAVYRKCSVWENVPDQYVEKTIASASGIPAWPPATANSVR